MKKLSSTHALLALTVLLICATAAWGRDPCLNCHDRPGLESGGRSFWIEPERYNESVHAKLSCGDCHKGVRGFPHPEAATLRCDLLCHVQGASHAGIDEQVKASPHAALGDNSCISCHEGGGALRGGDAAKLCRSCHQGLDPAVQVYPSSPGDAARMAHARVSEAGRAPDCLDCHKAHATLTGVQARSACSAQACHPGQSEAFGQLFDHGPKGAAQPWGGAGRAVLIAAIVVGALLLLHSVRG